MTCIKAQSMITPFVNNKLNIKEMEEFLDHIDTCPICMEELEFYYTLLTAMEQLNEDKELSDDFKFGLSCKIKRAQDKIIHVKYTYYRKTIILILLMILLAFLLGIRYADRSDENSISASESDLHIRKPVRLERLYYIDEQLQDYFDQMELEKVSDTDSK